jgi:hypothetical protein
MSVLGGLPDRAGAAGALDFSAAAESDRDFAFFYDHRYLAATVRILQHALKPLVILQNVDVFEWDLASREILTGSRSIGAQILTENENGFCYHASGYHG